MGIETQAKGLYAFEADVAGGELSFGAGEILTVVRQDIGEGWWEARNSQGQSGLVPEAYMEIVSMPEPKIPPPPPPPSYPVASAPPEAIVYEDSWPEPPAQTQSYENNGTSSHNTNNQQDEWRNGTQNQGSWSSAPPAQLPPPPTSTTTTAQQQQQYQDNDDWDSDWDDDSSSVTTEQDNMGGQGNYGLHPANRNSGGSQVGDSQKFGTVRKTFGRFSAFSKSGGDAYILGQAPAAPDSERRIAVIETADGMYWQQNDAPYSCQLSSPKKETKLKGLKSFTSYQLVPSFSNIQVSRRYKHFDWLHERLVIKFPSIAVPPLPDKQVTGRYEDDFIAERMRQLQLWLDRMVRHPVICQSDVLHHFLTCTDDKRWKQGKRKAEKDEYQGGKFFLTVQTPAPPIETTTLENQIENFGIFSKKMDDGVRHLLNIMHDNQKKHVGPFKREYQKIGNSLTAIAEAFEMDSAEASQPLTKAIHQTGMTYEQIGQLFHDQPPRDSCILQEGLHEYKGLLSTFPEILQVHRGSMNKVRDCQRAQEEGRMSESELQAASGRADVISYCLLAEMSHFQQDRVVDFKDMIKHYLKEQIEFHKKVTAKLEDALHVYEQL